jgi:hypothetical protein
VLSVADWDAFQVLCVDVARIGYSLELRNDSMNINDFTVRLSLLSESRLAGCRLPQRNNASRAQP